MWLLILPITLICYFLGIFFSFAGTGSRSRGIERAGAAFLVAGWLLHLLDIAYEGIRVGAFPMRNSAEYLLVLGWIVISLHLFLWFRQRILVAGVVLPPMAMVMTLAALLIPAPTVVLPPSQREGWFIFHTSVATVGMAALCVTFAMALTYLVQDRALKAKRSLKLLERLPSLDAVDRIGFHALLWGFPLLTLGIATGAIWSSIVKHRVWTGGPKEVFPVLAWIVFALLLYARLVRGFRGRKAAYVTIAGFALGLLTVVGMTR
jgi:ABC-type transport system involved in cytochrome c biogenesis permease subunit